jgi:hypothetical protein
MLDGELSIDDFGDWVLGMYGDLSINARNHGARQFVGFVIGQVTLFDVEEIDAETLKRTLAEAIANPANVKCEDSK